MDKRDTTTPHPAASPPRGLLHPSRPLETITSEHSRRLPSEDLRPFVEHYWSVSWDLRGKEPLRRETLPHPSVHLVFQHRHSRVQGVVKGRFTVVLEGTDRVFGVKFRPAGFFPFARWPISRLTDGSLPIAEVFGPDGAAVEEAMLELDDEAARIALAERFLLARLPPRDPTGERVQGIVARILDDREIVKVDDLLAADGLDKRTLQRLFSRYVGVSPKWVIQRYRLHEAAEQLASGTVADWPRLALDLGYFDQAHFIRDFKRVLGTSPARYSRRIAGPSRRAPARRPGPPGGAPDRAGR